MIRTDRVEDCRMILLVPQGVDGLEADRSAEK